MPEHITWDGVVRSVTDFWMPLAGWFAAAAIVWLAWRLFRRNGGGR